MALHIFFAGESAQVAENLDANFQYLLNLIPGQGNTATAAGTSIVTAFSRYNFLSAGTASGQATVAGASDRQVQQQMNGVATGTATDSYILNAKMAVVATATGLASVSGFNQTPSVATATGTSTTSYVLSAQILRVATASATCTVSGTGGYIFTSVGTATGTSSTSFASPGGAVESPTGTTYTDPSQAPIYASGVVGQPSSTNLHSFQLTANPGIVKFDGANDATTSNVVELYYAGHILYRQNQDGTWFSWVSAGTWQAASNPTPAFQSESPEGAILLSPSQTLFSSLTPGVPAPVGATVANGQLIPWTLTANPGQVIRNSVTDTTTANVIELYYHNHNIWQENSSNLWWFYTPGSNPPWTQAAAPIPSTPAINIALLPAQVNTFSTFQVSGTYQAFPGTGNPTLQYADSTAPSTYAALPSTVNVTPTSFSFIHPPVLTANPAFFVSVRDATNTGTVGQSNTIQVQTSGTVTLAPMTLDNTTFQSGKPAGTFVGNLSIPVSGGSFTGTVTSSNANFTVSGTGVVRQLVTTAVLSAGTVPNVILTATMINATNTGETLTVTLNGIAESPQATDITTVGGSIVGSSVQGTPGSQFTWALLSGGKISLNGTSQTLSSGVVELYYISHTLFMGTGTLGNPQWSYFNGTGVVGGQYGSGSFTSCATPKPNILLSSTSFLPGTNGPTGITATLNSASTANTPAVLPNVTWTDDSPSFVFVGNAINTSGLLPAGVYNVNLTATIPTF